MSTRVKRPDHAHLVRLLKDELGGLRQAFGSLVVADREKTAALEAHHVAYAAASQRAELAEQHAARSDSLVVRLERELAEARGPHDATISRPRPDGAEDA